MLAVVQTEFRYRGRNISGAEIESVRQLIAAHPGLSRRRLSAKLCQDWNWVQANGQLRDMVARGLMLQLHRAGLIVLPAKRKSVPNNAARHRAPLLEPPLEVAPLECDLAELGPLEIRQVRRTPEEALFGRLLQTYHYLGYRRPVNGVALVLSHIGDAQMCDLGNPCACVIEQLKEETIAAASPAGGRGSLQDRLDLGFGKEPNQRPFPALSGNGQDRLQLRGLIDRIKRQEIPGKGPQGAQAGVATAGLVVSIFLQVIQKGQHIRSRKVREVQGRG
jgi:hypothetical protein